MTIRIPAEFDGRLLRSYLKLTLGLSSAVLSRLKKHERGILVNGERVTVRYTLRTGDILELRDRDTAESVARDNARKQRTAPAGTRGSESVLPADLPLEVLYEDDYLIALNKPAGMPTHPSHGHSADTLANALAYRYSLAAEPFVFRPLGRLDRNTSGVVVVGKTRAATGFLGRALQRGEVSKRYLAVVTGEMPSNQTVHTVIAPICRPDAGVIMRAVCDDDTPGGMYAETRYRVLAAGNGHSLLLCEPVTGRTHQLRVHLSHIGHPILGDELYGEVSPLINRHALHALSLSVPMPFSRAMGEATVAVGIGDLDPTLPLNTPTPDGYLHTWAPLPADMSSLILSLFPHDHVPSAPCVGDLPLMSPHT